MTRIQRFSCSLPCRSSSGGRCTTRPPFADSAAEQREGMKPMRNHLRSVIGASVMLVASLTASQQACAQAPAGTLAFTGARLIDGSGSEPIENAVLVVENGRVAAAGPENAVRVPDGAARIDAAGKTIVPGFVNGHGHVQVEQNGTLPEIGRAHV